jgi:hypothetical protein
MSSWLKEKIRNVFPKEAAPAGISHATALSASRRIDEITTLVDYETLVSQLPATVRPHNFLATRLATQSNYDGEQCVDAFEDAYSFTGPHSAELVSRFGLDPLRLVDAVNAVSAAGRRYLREFDAKKEGASVTVTNDALSRKQVEREISLTAEIETDLIYAGKKESGPVTTAIYDWLAAASRYAPQLFDSFSASANDKGDLTLTYTGKPRDWSVVTVSPLDRPGQGPRFS